MTAVIYAGYSSDSQREESIDGQAVNVRHQGRTEAPSSYKRGIDFLATQILQLRYNEKRTQAETH